MSIGALAFLSPWLLGALVALPVIYWLLRTVPPRPRQIAFPPTRILVGLEPDAAEPAAGRGDEGRAGGSALRWSPDRRPMATHSSSARPARS